jgi:RimJ/RimL family protein N-acetyltransferase
VTELPAPSDIRLETAHFILRTLTADDPLERAAAWLADPAKAAMINAPARAMPVEAFRKYLASHDRVRGHLLGIFAKEGGALVGFWAVYIDWDEAEFLVNVLVGERGRVSHRAREETQMALLEHFFDVAGLKRLRCTVLARNRYVGFKLLRDCGATLEHTSWKPSATSEAFVEIHHYRADAATWHRLRERLRARGA